MCPSQCNTANGLQLRNCGVHLTNGGRGGEGAVTLAFRVPRNGVCVVEACVLAMDVVINRQKQDAGLSAQKPRQVPSQTRSMSEATPGTFLRYRGRGASEQTFCRASRSGRPSLCGLCHLGWTTGLNRNTARAHATPHSTLLERERLPSARPASKSIFRPSIPMLYHHHTNVGVPFSQLQKHMSFMHDWKKWW